MIKIESKRTGWLMKLSPVYEPNKYEQRIYELWEESGAFAPRKQTKGETYSIVMPPPNANANLHIGYALTAALEDIPTRYHRMTGKATLLLPGADHAGFETQVVYEKQLAQTGKSRFDFTHEELRQQIRDFVALNRTNLQQQIREMGISCDWNHFTYTLDENIVETAYSTFKKMWDEGLIYRGERLVNFCTFHGTGFADIEVEHKEEHGHLWYICYPLTDGSGEITVATTRPETMLGDTAIAVNPNDKRMKKYIGKTVKLPLTNREIPIIADDMVDIEFGTGAVKITPAHDPNDYEAGQRHDLPMVTVIGSDGTMTPEAGEQYRGLTVEQARKQVVKDLDEASFLIKTEDYTHNVGHCYKCGTIIQPLLRDQWFVDMKPLAAKAIAALKANKITFYPASKLDQLITYLEGLKDWNISRQIAWGIPIPAFQNVDNPDDWIYDERVENETLEINGKIYRRDPDVFDTWFSSSSWPYATLGQPDNKDLSHFYPLSLMETGGEILYPWVSRMIMLGLYVTNKVPFTSVYIHGYVMAEDGSKMSKSVGNVVDPRPVIKEHGSDALRMGLISGRAPAVNRGYDTSKVEGARNFCNKLWNIARYIESKTSGYDTANKPSPETVADHWVLNILQQSVDKIASDIENYRFAEAYDTLYHTIWDDVADWYIEASKSQTGQGMLRYVLEIILKIAHPFAPFVTETIWQTLSADDSELLITSAWPTVMKADKTKAAEFESIKDVVTEVRHLSRALKLTKPTLLHATTPLLENNSEIVAQLAKLGNLKTSKSPEGVRLVSVNAWLEAPETRLKAYVGELETKLTETRGKAESYKKRLSNEAYVANAPERIVQDTRDQLASAEAEIKLLGQEVARFSS